MRVLLIITADMYTFTYNIFKFLFPNINLNFEILFFSDRSGMILTEWHHQGNNKTKAQKRKKQKARRKLRDAEAKAQREKEKQRKEDEEERSSEASSNKENNTPNHNQVSWEYVYM